MRMTLSPAFLAVPGRMTQHDHQAFLRLAPDAPAAPAVRALLAGLR